jgi:hypothetical protein
VLGPSAVQKPLSDAELEVLEQVGEHWRSALGGRRLRRSSLPTDPDLEVSALTETGRYERVVQMQESFVPVQPGELLAGTGAIEPPTGLERTLLAARRSLIGPPLATTALVEERLSKLKALAILSSDALSSVAYGTEAMLSVLVLAGTAAVAYSLPIAGVIVLLMLAVGLSYRQTAARTSWRATTSGSCPASPPRPG